MPPQFTIADACPSQYAKTQGHDSQVFGGSPEYYLDSAFKNPQLHNAPWLPKPEGTGKTAGGAETTNSLLQRLVGHKAFGPKVVTLGI